jgi:deazaflavin-dependent oxidoreductase (nitroreductase family)
MSRFSSAVRRLGHRPGFAAVGRRLVALDRLLGRLTRGRFVGLGMRDLPCLLLTTTGRRSGQPRTTPLLFVRDGDGYVVVGSNWGQTAHPAWSANLLADPNATVTLDGRRFAVRARRAGGAERDRLFALLRSAWPAYQTYAERAAGRDLRVFRLEPTSAPR